MSGAAAERNSLRSADFPRCARKSIAGLAYAAKVACQGRGRHIRLTPVSDVGYTRGVTANSVKRYLCIAISLPLAGLLAQTQQPGGDPSISPNKQWEYRVSKESAVLVKAGSEEPVVDLAEEIGGLAIESGKVVWAPDSRRFAFNTRKGGKYYGCELYELKGTTWEKLPQLETSAEAVEQLIERTLAKQRKRLGAEKGAGDYADDPMARPPLARQRHLPGIRE